MSPTITRLVSPILFHIAQTKFTTTPLLGHKQAPPALHTISSRVQRSNSRSASVTDDGCSVRPLMCGSARAITSCGYSGFPPGAAVHAIVNPCTMPGCECRPDLRFHFNESSLARDAMLHRPSPHALAEARLTSTVANTTLQASAASSLWTLEPCSTSSASRDSRPPLGEVSPGL